MQEPEKILTLAEVGGMLRVIASAMVREHGAYYCMVDGKRVKVVA